MDKTGPLLRAWRERALLTQEQLAEKSGVGVRTIRRLESGDPRPPRSSSLGLLAAALELAEDEHAALVAAVRGTPVPVGDDSTGPVPRQLPAPPQGFTGRTDELARLTRVRDPAAVVIAAIDGMAGTGKTALAVHAAHQLADLYPDGQLFVDLHGHTEGMAPVEPGDALDRLLRALDVPGQQIPADVDERAALYRSRLADRKVLVVLDNAADEAQVGLLLPGSPGCLVLVTSRRRLAGLDHTHMLSLDVLPLADAVALLVSSAGEQRLAGAAPEVLAEVVGLCGRLPLAIRVAAARLRSRPTWPVARLVARLRDHQLRLAELEAGQRSVAAALDVSYRELGPRLRRAYRLSGLHPGGDFDSYAAAALADTTLGGAEKLIDQLLDAHLLQEPTPGRFRFHDLVRDHAVATSGSEESEDARLAAVTRLLDHYTEQFRELLTEFDDDTIGYAFHVEA